MKRTAVQTAKSNTLTALPSLKKNKYLGIVDDPDMDSPSMAGSRLSLKAFKAWVANAENVPTRVSLFQAKSKWVRQRKKL